MSAHHRWRGDGRSSTVCGPDAQNGDEGRERVREEAGRYSVGV